MDSHGGQMSGLGSTSAHVLAQPTSGTQEKQQPGQQGPRVKLYIDLMSQPSRACVIFSRMNGLPVDVVPVLIHKGETRSAPFKTTINPLGQVPALEDPSPTGASGPLLLPESAAILSYLSYKYDSSVPEHWYPRRDAVWRARVDAALHWFQGNIRAGAVRLIFNKVVAALLGLPSDPATAAEGLKVLQSALPQLQKYWLADGARPYMTGDLPCIADLLGVTELEQLRLLDKSKEGIDLDEILAPYPAVQKWMGLVRQYCQPQYSEVSRVLDAAVTARRSKM